MKFYILGSSSSGKTTYARLLSEKYSLKHYNTDYLRYVQKKNKRGRVKRNEEEYKAILNEINKSDNWVFEGLQTIPFLLDSADKIVWLKIPLVTSLFRQWKRFCTDEKQRKEHGFINNLKLSRGIIFSLYLGRYDQSKVDDPDYNHMKKIPKLLKKYSSKTIVTANWKSIEEI